MMAVFNPHDLEDSDGISGTLLVGPPRASTGVHLEHFREGFAMRTPNENVEAGRYLMR
jgi:hypothetical protein